MINFSILGYAVAILAFIVGSVSGNATLGFEQHRIPDAPKIRVMSFNIRYGTAKDGDYHWQKRRQTVVKVIKDFCPDLLGTQETLSQQASFLKQHLTDFAYVGRGRQVEADQGEQCGIFFRKSRFQLIDSGNFWLSETPDRPGSRGWDAALPRIATWVRLRDRSTQSVVYFLNTHFDHKGRTARLRSGELIRTHLQTQKQKQWVIVTGDFNEGPDSPVYQALFQLKEASPLQDTFRARHPNLSAGTGTFHAFTGRTSGSRIDWIGASTSFHVIHAQIERTSAAGRYPSDHFPVTAILAYPSVPKHPNQPSRKGCD